MLLYCMPDLATVKIIDTRADITNAHDIFLNSSRSPSSPFSWHSSLFFQNCGFSLARSFEFRDSMFLDKMKR